MVYELFGTGTFGLVGTCLTFTPNMAGSYDVTNAGAFCPVSAPTPLDIRADNVPTIGMTTTITCANLPLTTSGAVLLMGSPIEQNVPLDGIGATGCSLLVNNIFFDVGMTIMMTDATISFAFPNDPVSIGATIDLQAVAIDPSFNALDVALSDLGRLVLGG